MEDMMPYCTSCGSEIPEGQGRSCSMCYGDIAHGRDGYYQAWAEEQERQMSERAHEMEQQIEEQRLSDSEEEIPF